MGFAPGDVAKAQQAYLWGVRMQESMAYPVVTVAPDTSVAAAAEMWMPKHGPQGTMEKESLWMPKTLCTLR
jgi:hypothetical protein